MNVLVVMDMQNDFITGALPNKEAYKIIPNIKETIKQLKQGENII